MALTRAAPGRSRADNAASGSACGRRAPPPTRRPWPSPARPTLRWASPQTPSRTADRGCRQCIPRLRYCKKCSYDTISLPLLEVQVILLDEAHELSDQIRPGFPVDVLEIQRSVNIGMNEDVMAT